MAEAYVKGKNRVEAVALGRKLIAQRRVGSTIATWFHPPKVER